MNVYYKYITNRKKLKRYRNHRPIENNTVRLANLEQKTDRLTQKMQQTMF